MKAMMERAFWKAGLLAAALGLLGFTIALAASGGLDTTFSGDGKQLTDFSGGWVDEIYGLALQSDGKIVAAGVRYDPAHYDASTSSFAVARYTANGKLDSTFSADGKVLTDFGKTDAAEDVAIQPSDGKIVVIGKTCVSTNPCDVAVARYNKDGKLDATFNGSGKKIIDFGGGDNGTMGGVAIQSDGKIVISGWMTNSSGNYDLAILRLNPNGSLDSTFSGDGKVHVGFGPGLEDFAYDMVLEGGKILAAGQECDTTYKVCNAVLVRFTASGALDTTFSGDGKQAVDFGAADSFDAVALQPDGKIVAAGERYTGSIDNMTVARFKTDGSLDATFNGTGKKVITIGTWSMPWDLVVQANSKIVVAGIATGATNNFALVRLNPGGGLDSTFSGDGKAMIDFAGGNDWGRALALQSDGKYVIGGWSSDTGIDFALARVLP